MLISDLTEPAPYMGQVLSPMGAHPVSDWALCDITRCPIQNFVVMPLYEGGRFVGCGQIRLGVHYLVQSTDSSKSYYYLKKSPVIDWNIPCSFISFLA